MGNKNLRFGR